LNPQVERQVIGVRAALKQSGLDNRPISVHDKMRSLGMIPIPSKVGIDVESHRSRGVAEHSLNCFNVRASGYCKARSGMPKVMAREALGEIGVQFA